ncbi:MAG TPA: tetratricopeptide repeat protein [Candidatus Didemnitutus sp.]|nr:tetratricopeptide repeat protein [Candidatus Didemnitutus sp.]
MTRKKPSTAPGVSSAAPVPKPPDTLEGNPWLAAAAIVVLVFVAYARVWGAGFIWDDDAHVTPVALRSAHGLWRIWTEPGATQQYYPLLHSLFWLEFRLWGDASLGYHLANLLLHSSVAILLALTLRRLGLKGAWVAAAIFAVHPVMVESVAWISEQKNTLSAALYFAAALAYLNFDTRRRPGAYGLATLLFVGALTAKTVTATLPAALLVIFWWQRGKLSLRRDVAPLLPWFALSGVAGLVTAWMERTSVGATGEMFKIGGIERFLIAGRAVGFYFGKLLVPSDLIFIYPRWEISRAHWVDWLPLAGPMLVMVLAWSMRHRSRAPLAVILLYVGTLFPALGFIDVYPFQFSFVADHFQYLAAPVVIAGIVAGLGAAFARVGSRARPFLFAGAAVTTVLCAAATCRSSARFVDSETIWRDTLARNPGCWMARNNLGADLLQAGHPDEAVALIESAVQLAPRNPAGRINLGEARLMAGRVSEALTEFREAVALAPANAEAQADLASGLLQQGNKAEAATHAAEALRLRPGLAKAWSVQGNIELANDRRDAALENFNRALTLDPSDVSARSNRGAILAQEGRLDEAIVEFQRAALTQPRNAAFQLNLATAQFQAGHLAPALASFRRAVDLPNAPAAAHRNFGLALLQSGDAGAAEVQFRAAVASDPHDAESHRQLGGILYRRGDLDAARRELERAGPLK